MESRKTKMQAAKRREQRREVIRRSIPVRAIVWIAERFSPKRTREVSYRMGVASLVGLFGVMAVCVYLGISLHYERPETLRAEMQPPTCIFCADGAVDS